MAIEKMSPMGSVYRNSQQKTELLIESAWERMERDRKAEEAEKASAAMVVGALVRAAEKEGDANGDAD